jgi:hypothetical protein
MTKEKALEWVENTFDDSDLFKVSDDERKESINALIETIYKKIEKEKQ